MEDTRARWERAFIEALDYDTWGQVEEAIEGYQRLQVAAAAEFIENVLQIPIKRREGIGKLASTLKSRIQELQKSSDLGIGLKGMKTLKVFLKDLIVSDAEFPLHNVELEAGVGGLPTLESLTSDKLPDFEDVSTPTGQAGLSGPPSGLRSGDRVLSIRLEKWGFKDAAEYVDPRLVMSVRDASGGVLEAVQETPPAKKQTSIYVFFEEQLHIQTPLDKIPSSAAIFFELRHYKPKEQKKSIKAYCYMEMDEVKEGPITLEVYKKPTIYKRGNNPALLSVKPLYLHLNLTIHSEP